MNQKYIDALYRDLINNQGYLPIRNMNGELVIQDNFRILHNYSYNTNTIIDIIDGDGLGCQEIKDRLDMNKTMLFENDGNSNLHIFVVFVFSTIPDENKLDLIKTMQYQQSPGGKYLSCFSLSLSGKKVEKHFKLPPTSRHLEKVLSRTLMSNYAQMEVPLDIHALVNEKLNEYKIDYKAKKPYFTYALLGINILIFILLNLYTYYITTKYNLDHSTYSQNIYSNLLHIYGSKVNELIVKGEYWRLMTPIFLHANIPHLVMNSYSLYALGILIERMFGNLKFIMIYLLAGIIGSIASFAFSPYPSVGASGAIFGLMGSLLYFGLEKPAAYKRYFGFSVILTIGVNIIFGLSVQNIDNFAHIGGLIGGFLATGAVKATDNTNKYLNRKTTVLLTALILIGGLIYGFYKNPLL